MEMQSPRSSMGGESPLKPSSVDSSPPQKKEEEEEEMKSQAVGSSEPAEPQKEELTGRTVPAPLCAAPVLASHLRQLQLDTVD